ncbi:hypothetical protein M422DRAFT_265676 [Sphaerobolus stellatus SS14]|uniref:Uncharacterized protein n=1 Tax=Sphaerobolus stellatus (strain SS14) TaxID=990650 RepID=A0A0C9V502_SPHS4|nr:hypothetical protein M422DRAFT_265676 [Sphaerobolus stellatus SS14]
MTVETLQTKLEKSNEANTILCKKNHALDMHLSHSQGQQERAVAKVRDEALNLELKEKGVVKDRIRNAAIRLLHLGVPTENVNSVIECVAEVAGMPVKESMSSWTVRHVIKEGGVAVQLQIAEAVKESNSITLSGDGTTHKNVNSTNHTAQKQLEGLQDQISSICVMYNEMVGSSHEKVDARSFPLKLQGICTDHAADQKLLVELLKDWKIKTDREVRGDEKLLSLPPEQFKAVLSMAYKADIEAMGGLDTWNALPESEQSSCKTGKYQELCLKLGQEIFKRLKPEEQEDSDRLVRVGCCMHKELNSIKGGTAEMQTAWDKLGLEGPMKYFNKDNSATFQVGDGVSKTRAADASQSGAIKLTSLAGSLFNHKDDKKGHQGSLVIFFEGKLGHSVRFQDTSNTRYQSHCEAAAELLVHREIYLAFLEEIKEKKENCTLNNMELNVYQDLQDLPTLSELTVLALFANTVSHPYMCRIRSPDQQTTNALDLGPLHSEVLSFMQCIIEDPDIILGEAVTEESASFDKKVWDQSEVFSSIMELKKTLPYLWELLVAFFAGAAVTWKRFTSEYETGGVIEKLSLEKRLQAWMLSTNDINEGALGSYRVTMRQAPNMTEETYNASTMSKMNGTLTWMEETCTPKDRASLHRKAREIDEQHLEKKRQKIQAEYNAEVVCKKREQDAVKKAKKDATTAKILTIIPIKTVEELEKKKPIVSELDIQLDWYRQVPGHSIPKKSVLGRKQLKIEALKSVIEHFKMQGFFYPGQGQVPDFSMVKNGTADKVEGCSNGN